MTLDKNIKVNKKIMQLIRSKYNELFPAGYNTPESRYYLRLQLDVHRARKYLAITAER